MNYGGTSLHGTVAITNITNSSAVTQAMRKSVTQTKCSNTTAAVYIGLPRPQTTAQSAMPYIEFRETILPANYCTGIYIIIRTNVFSVK